MALTAKEEAVRHPKSTLAIVMAIALAVRMIGIEKQPLWGDEGLTLLIAQWPLATLFTSSEEPTPGLYYALHKFFIGTDAGLLEARLISIIAGTLAVGAVFAVALASRIPSTSAAILAAFSFPLIDYSQEARAYSLLILLIVLSGLALIFWHRSRGWAPLLCFATLLLLSFYTHFVSIFWIAPIVTASILLTKRDRDGLRKLGLVLCLIGVLAIPELKRLITYPREFFSWLDQPAALDAIYTTAQVLLPTGYFSNNYWHLNPNISAFVAVLCSSFLCWQAISNRRALNIWARENRAAAAVLVISLLLPLMIWLFGYIAKPIFMQRTILIGVPGFLMALSLLLSMEHRIVLPLVTGLYALNLAFTGTSRPKEDWPEVANRLAADVRDGDVVLLCPGWKAAAFRHAVKKQINAPLVLLWNNGRVQKIESKIGSNPDWAIMYFSILEEGRGFAEGRAALAGATRTWRISADCKRRLN